MILLSWKAPKQPFSGYYMIDWTHNGEEYNWMKTSFTNATLFGRLECECEKVNACPREMDIEQICHYHTE